ncbi:hypothetical protein BAE44_0015474 [Dichanthelium oligosanthes]|uniref:Wall-associated receptor kinase galacturonan-binding domain-containing protein n=1 Tax=Dichanthelium oligosanthes TaxID=888268 RepID=A0A1E5VEE3_9POAL|nr:hypothetical protein BAE44_0015474 [Dichanthelium oligosanthes]
MAASQLSAALAAAAGAIGLPGYATSCGNVTVPYPFGLGPARCSWPGFNLTCDASHGGGAPRLLLGSCGCGSTVLVAGISLRNATLRVLRTGPVYFNYTASDITVAISPYSLAATRNELTFLGCDVEATLLGVRDQDRRGYGGGGNASTESVIASCATNCSEVTKLSSSRYCNG